MHQPRNQRWSFSYLPWFCCCCACADDRPFTQVAEMKGETLEKRSHSYLFVFVYVLPACLASSCALKQQQIYTAFCGQYEWRAKTKGHSSSAGATETHTHNHCAPAVLVNQPQFKHLNSSGIFAFCWLHFVAPNAWTRCVKFGFFKYTLEIDDSISAICVVFLDFFEASTEMPTKS